MFPQPYMFVVRPVLCVPIIQQPYITQPLVYPTMPQYYPMVNPNPPLVGFNQSSVSAVNAQGSQMTVDSTSQEIPLLSGNVRVESQNVQVTSPTGHFTGEQKTKKTSHNVPLGGNATLVHEVSVIERSYVTQSTSTGTTGGFPTTTTAPHGGTESGSSTSGASGAGTQAPANSSQSKSSESRSATTATENRSGASTHRAEQLSGANLTSFAQRNSSQNSASGGGSNKTTFAKPHSQKPGAHWKTGQKDPISQRNASSQQYVYGNVMSGTPLVKSNLSSGGAGDPDIRGAGVSRGWYGTTLSDNSGDQSGAPLLKSGCDGVTTSSQYDSAIANIKKAVESLKKKNTTSETPAARPSPWLPGCEPDAARDKHVAESLPTLLASALEKRVADGYCDDDDQYFGKSSYDESNEDDFNKRLFSLSSPWKSNVKRNVSDRTIGDRAAGASAILPRSSWSGGDDKWEDGGSGRETDGDGSYGGRGGGEADGDSDDNLFRRILSSMRSTDGGDSDIRRDGDDNKRQRLRSDYNNEGEKSAADDYDDIYNIVEESRAKRALKCATLQDFGNECADDGENTDGTYNRLEKRVESQAASRFRTNSSVLDRLLASYTDDDEQPSCSKEFLQEKRSPLKTVEQLRNAAASLLDLDFDASISDQFAELSRDLIDSLAAKSGKGRGWNHTGEKLDANSSFRGGSSKRSLGGGFLSANSFMREESDEEDSRENRFRNAAEDDEVEDPIEALNKEFGFSNNASKEVTTSVQSSFSDERRQVWKGDDEHEESALFSRRNNNQKSEQLPLKPNRYASVAPGRQVLADRSLGSGDYEKAGDRSSLFSRRTEDDVGEKTLFTNAQPFRGASNLRGASSVRWASSARGTSNVRGALNGRSTSNIRGASNVRSASSDRGTSNVRGTSQFRGGSLDFNARKRPFPLGTGNFNFSGGGDDDLADNSTSPVGKFSRIGGTLNTAVSSTPQAGKFSRIGGTLNTPRNTFGLTRGVQWSKQ